MKISCQSCAAKYTIADEKVVGKVIKLKCKKCSSTIVVNGNDPGVVAQLQRGEADDAATQLMSQQHAYGGEAANPDEWTVSVTDDDQRTMTTAQILNEYAKGALTHDTYVWRDGMGDWSPLLEVPELAQLLQQASQEATAVAPAPAAMHQNGNGHGYAPAAAAAAPMAAAAAATASTPPPGVSAARRAGAKGGGVDLFGGGGLQQETARGAPAPTSPSDKHIGERNETSVLFSLKDLAAAEASAAKAPAKKDPFDTRKNDRVDDILSLGGVGAAPMLAPPPLMAPVIEPPPPPPPPPSVHPPASGMMISQAHFAPPPQKASPIPFIVGGVGVLALLGGIIFFVVAGGSDKDKTDAGKTATTQESKPAETSKPAEPSATETAQPTETAAPTADPLASASAEPSADPTSTAPRDPKIASTDPKKDDPKKDDPKKDDPKKDDPKKDDPPASGGDAPFDRGAASAALGAAAGSAKGCKKADGPTGSTKVQVTFAPSGRATQAVVGAPFAGTSVGSCIASTFKSAKVPPFSGGAMTVSKTVSIK